MSKFIKNKKLIFTLIMILSVLALVACESGEISKEIPKGDLRVHYLDVGQGDSALIQLPNSEVALIDGGDRGDGDDLVDYIKRLDIEKIDYVIATHPHSDHIGGLPEVIENFEIGKIYMPDKMANTKIFEKLLNAIKDKDLKIIQAKSGMTIIDQDNLEFSIIAPIGEGYDNVNDYSIVNKLTYKNISLLFTGDAEKQAESELVSSGVDLSADVLKVGHHGSDSSSTDEFLDKVNPKYGIISCAIDNSYGHPHKEVIEKFNKRNIKILRTDEMGTIVADSDGKNIDFNTESNSNIENNLKDKDEAEKDYGKTDISEKIYIGNKNTRTYHDEDCGRLPNLENRVTFNSKQQAEKEGYRPHSTCIK